MSRANNLVSDIVMNIGNSDTRPWWKDASVYHIYPASFYDSNGDGIGDINGVAAKLDYIKSLGVEIVWLSPIYKSPQVDMGYDVADYEEIHRPYGTMADVDNLIAELHKRGMKLVMDLVVNHTSDQHHWFQESRSSKNNHFRDWYVWKPPRYDSEGRPHPPNNWEAMFGGSTWTYDDSTSEYYLHSFAPEQPDLNWEHPPVVDAVHNVVRFWLKKGVSGFRMDVINFISKNPSYPDAPILEPRSDLQDATGLYTNGPRLHEHLKGLGAILRQFGAFSVGEMPFAKDVWQVLEAVSTGAGELNMIFQFDVVDIDIGPGGKFAPHKWDLKTLKGINAKWQNFMHANSGWNAIFSENHDQSRTVSRFASDSPAHRFVAAKMLATWNACLSGTIFIFQGQELGMRNMPEDWSIEEYKDIETQKFWNELLTSSSHDPSAMATALSQIHLKARDHARTPVQWSSAAHGGFTTGSEPWMRANPDYLICNADMQVKDEGSVYHYWACLLALRKKYREALVHGSFSLVDADNEFVFAYQKAGDDGSAALVILNWSPSTSRWTVPTATWSRFAKARCVLSNYDCPETQLQKQLDLQPWEALILFSDASQIPVARAHM